ncbi:hypothetical protein JKF63_07419 [Porcisia hertigi]|uniref:Paraflagellar rod protein n=1 Tax=Porcisia hertigi TaxID=2761500 RepID=A0A836YIR5_9TRYP|nr:hypothetical protein JKF63_07419 [Porcisia hertigi]
MASPNPIGGGSRGALIAGLEDDDVGVPLTLETPTEQSTAHARLTLLENAIRVAISSTVPGSAPAPSRVRAPESKCPTNASAASPNPPPLKSPLAELGTPSDIMETPTGASERLSTLHDNLLRVRNLMQQYEESSQRIIKVHLIPSPETGELILGSVAIPTEDAAKGQKKTNALQNSSNWANANNNGGSSSSSNVPVNGDGKQAAEPQKTTPSLHQRRALASDAALAHFCGLRITPDQLLLPLRPPPADPTGGSATLLAQQGIHARDVDAENSASVNSDGGTSRCTGNSTRKGQAASSASSKVMYGYAASNPKGRQPSCMLPPQHRTNVEAALKSYAEFFYKPPITSSAAAVEVVQSLEGLQQQVAALQRCRLFSYEAQLKAESADSPSKREGVGSCASGTTRTTNGSAVASRTAMDNVQSANPSWQHVHVAAQHMQNSLTALQTRWTRESNYACCGRHSIDLVHGLQSQTQLLIRQLEELLSKPVLEEVGENTREKLRRMKFDVKEMQQAQAEAIASGDMQHSEELYYEQTSLAESMAEPYDELEAKMVEYGETCISAPLKNLLKQRDALTTWLTHTIEENSKKLSEVDQDVNRVKEKRRAVAQARRTQRDNMSTYQHCWKKEWQKNSDQQMDCYRAMEQLEKQLLDLQKAQILLVDDWISRVSQERQREEDAAAFACFADARASSLAETQRNLQAVVDGLREFNRGVDFTCGHTEAFAREVLQGHLSESQLALRKDRLEQFRILYFTLGDLRFKKMRNAEEIQKKVEYYALQQEVAMDVLNPKAKEFSRAKQRWESAKAEAQAQIEALDRRSQLQLEAFRPTENLLRQSGVDFVSPEEELARRMQQRSQKLLEYQQQMEECMGVRQTTTPSNVASASMDVLSRKSATNRFSSADLPTPPPRLQAVESMQPSTRLVDRGNKESTGQLPPIRRINRTYPPPQHADSNNGEDNTALAMTGEASVASTRRMIATSASAATAAPLASLHSTEERIMQDVSKTAMVNQGGRGTTSSAASNKYKSKKR